MTPSTQTLEAAWHAALATEYAAVFYYGALGPQLTDPGRHRPRPDARGAAS